MSNKIKFGDVVRLKSGGPKMTVSSVNLWDGCADCEWFDDKNICHYKKFSISSLKKVWW